MKTLIKLTKLTLLLSPSILLSCSQSSETDSQAEFENLQIADLELISEFDQSGDYFFQHLNYSTEVLSNGDILLNDRVGAFVIQINPKGQLVNLIARQGNGPGEVQDPQSIQMVNDSTLLIVDDQRRRIIKKTLNSSVIDENTLPQGNASRVNEAYATTDPDIISFQWFDFSALRDSNAEPVTRISSYKPVSQTFVSDIRYPGKTMALVLSESGQPIGASPVPYTSELLYDYSQDKAELYAFWPEDSEIAVLDPIQLDTLRTIPVNLPSESLSTAERDSLKGEYRPEYWESVEELLPDQKVPADKMIVDHQNRIWLKLTLQSDKQEWVVLGQDGSPVIRAQFPKGGIVTHVSKHHIGFRADDHLFSLYKFI